MVNPPRIAVLCLVAVALVLAGCGSEPASGPGTAAPEQPSAISGEWQLVSGTIGDRVFPLVDGYRVTVEFREDGTVAGRAACNGYGGTYDLDGPTLRLGDLVMTDMGCEPAVQDSESAFFEVLQRQITVTRDGDQMTMTANETELAFTPVPPVPTADLVGTSWELHTMFDQGSATNTRGRAMLHFDEDGSFEATTGCRVVAGTYRLDDAEIVVVERSVHGACPSEFTDQDRQVLAVLESPRVEIDGDELRLWSAGDRGLGYRAATP